MAIVFADNGKITIINSWFFSYGLGNKYLCLFTNPSLTINPSVGIGQFTEPTFAGYSRQAINALWGTPYMTSGFAETDCGSAVVWTVTSTGGLDVIYGYWVIDTNTNDWLWAETFPSPITMITAGNTLSITPKFQIGQC